MSGRTRQVTVNPRKVHFPQKSIHKTSKDSENQVDHFWRTLAGKSRKSHAVLSLREPAGYCPRSAGTDEDRASRLRPTWSGHLTCLPCGCSSSSHHYRHIVDVVIVIFITIISLLFVVITSRAESTRLGHQPRVAEVAREHGWHPPKSFDSDENFKPEHTLFCRKLRFVAIYALFFGDLWA